MGITFATGLNTDTIRAANIALALGFWPRSSNWLYPRICGSTISTSMVEPFALDGPAPIPVAYSGSLKSQPRTSYAQYVPNILFKSLDEPARNSIEFDQTGGLALKYISQFGIRAAQLYDYAFVSSILQGSLAASASYSPTEPGFQKGPFVTTIDGLPFFSQSHTWQPGATQSNEIQGQVPDTIAGVNAQDLATTANQMIRDYNLAFQTFLGYKDARGLNIYSSLDTGKQLVVVCPPALQPAATLAFKTPGVIGGTYESSAGSTTNIGPILVKDVFYSGLLAGCENPYTGGTVISPVNPTDYWFMIVDDYVKPLYLQQYRAPKPGETKPPGNDMNAAAEEAVKLADSVGLKTLNVDQATAFTEALVETNIYAQGYEAQRDVVVNESFFISGRQRFNFAYGLPFTAIRVVPASGSF